MIKNKSMYIRDMVNLGFVKIGDLNSPNNFFFVLCCCVNWMGTTEPEMCVVQSFETSNI